jgi:hypothetical protein
MAANFQNKKVVSKASAPVDPFNVPKGVDGSTFFSPAIPEEVKAAVPYFHKFPGPLLKGLISKILEYILNRESFTFDPASIADVSQDEVALVATGIYIVVRTAVRNKVKISVIKESLLSMNFPKDFTEDLCKAISRSRAAVEAVAVAKRIQFNKLEKLKWRIDVVISTGVLSRVMRPNILFQVSYLCVWAL